MRDATYIGRDDGSRFDCMQGIELAIAQSLGQFGLRDRIGTGRTTAQVRISKRLQIEPQLLNQVLTDNAQALPVLQGAWWMKSCHDRQTALSGLELDAAIGRASCRERGCQYV